MAVPGNATVVECRSNNDESFWDRCWLEYPPGAAHVVGDIVQPWINPRSVAVTGMLAVLLLPALARSRAIVLPPATYTALKLSALHFVLRAGYALVLDVALYTVFRQRRPCSCSTNGGPFVQVGSVYGMPSGDAMMAALLGAWVLDQAPRAWPRGAVLLLGLALPAAGMCERLAWGFHSAAQVSTGAALGAALYVWSTRAPLLVLVLEALVTPPVALALLANDPARTEWAVDGIAHPGGNNNLLSWVVWGLAFQLPAAALLLRHFCALGILGRMRHSLAASLRALDAERLAQPSPFFVSPAPGASGASGGGGGGWDALARSTRDPLLDAEQRAGEGSDGGTPSCFGAPSPPPARHFCEETFGAAPAALADGRATYAVFALLALPLLLLAELINYHNLFMGP